MGATSANHRVPASPSRRGATQAWAAGGDRRRRGSRATWMPRVFGRACGERILRPPPTQRGASDPLLSGPGASRGRRDRPRRGTHQKNTREQRLASCSGLGFTSVCTGSILTRVPRWWGCARFLEARVRMLDLPPQRRSARREPRRQRLPGTERRPALTPPPGAPRGRQLRVAAASWSPGAACRVRAQGDCGDRAQVPCGGRGDGDARPGEEATRAWHR